MVFILVCIFASRVECKRSAVTFLHVETVTGFPSMDVLIPVHNGLMHLTRCLSSLRKNITSIEKLILVDDASDPSIAVFIQEFSTDWPNSEIVTNSKRLGFTRSVNLGISRSTSNLLLLLNSDTFVPRGSLNAIETYMHAEPEFGIVGPMSNAAGFQSIPRFHRNLFERISRQTTANPMPEEALATELHNLLHKENRKMALSVPWLSGFCMAIRREVIEKVGTLNEAAFPDGYGEEIDFCLRARYAGWELGLLPFVFVGHHVSGSYNRLHKFVLTSRGVKTNALIHGAEKMIQESRLAEQIVTDFWSEPRPAEILASIKQLVAQ